MKMSLSLIAGLALTFAVGCASKKNMTDASAKTPAAEANAKTQNTAQKMEKMKNEKTAAKCTNKGDVRTIDIQAKDKGCVVKYTKFGKENDIASSAKGMSHCTKVFHKIQANLSKAGFKCE